MRIFKCAINANFKVCIFLQNGAHFLFKLQNEHILQNKYRKKSKMASFLGEKTRKCTILKERTRPFPKLQIDHILGKYGKKLK